MPETATGARTFVNEPLVSHSFPQRMNILLAPDKFRGSLTATEACQAMTEGIREAYPEAHIVALPLSDGGEGFLETLVEATQGTYHEVSCHDPLMRPITARWGESGDGTTAFIEMATASGLALLQPEEYQASQTTTYGTGELMRAAMASGIKKLVLGIGGSATTDGGIGMAQALGWNFCDSDGRTLPPVGASLPSIHSIHPPEQPAYAGVEIVVASDVTAPLFGPEGAAFVYSPQKGAGTQEVENLDAGLQQLAGVVSRTSVGISSLENKPGAGAAGGLGFGLMAFCGAHLRPGAELVMELVGLDLLLKKAELILTGEGKLDTQSLQGKLIGRLCDKAKPRNIPVLALCGTLAAPPTELRKLGLSYATSILTGPVDLPTALRTAYERLGEASFWAIHWYVTQKK